MYSYNINIVLYCKIYAINLSWLFAVHNIYLYSQDNYTNPILLKEMYTLKQFPIFSFDIELKQ